MSTITLPNIRVSSDLTIRLKLKDGGVAIDWSTLQNIRVSLYADDQRSMASRCNVSIDEEDSTILVCQYAANKMQYLGVNRVIVQCKYMGEVKTYDKPAFNFVRWTSDQEGEQITIDDPDVDVEISVEDVSSSILQEAVDAAFGAADRANDAAAAAEHMVDIHTGPAGKSPYIGENGHWYEWDEETHQYVDTETNAKGDTGETPDISIGTVTTVEPGTPAAASMSGTPEAPVLNLSIPQGVVGATPNFTIGTVTTGEPGSSVIVTITGTPEAPVLNLTIPQGMQGNTGSSVEYPYELVNNLTTNDATKGLSAAQGYVLDGKVSQLEAKVSDVLIPMGQLVVALFKKAAFLSNDAESDIHALESILSGNVDRIEAVYTQSGTIYAGQPLDDLKPDLVVTAYYLDGTSDVIDGYSLSGTLTAGTSTVTVTFGMVTTTFTVSVTAAVYYRSGSEMLRPYFLNSTNANYGPAIVDGVTLVYTRSKNSNNVVQVSRACYPYFDLDLTKGTNYKWMVKLGGLPTGAKVNVAVQYHNQAFKTDGLANTLANHSSDIMDSGWLTLTISDGILSFTYGSETASSALTLVGARLNLRLLDSSDNDIAWPDGSHIDALIIQTV